MVINLSKLVACQKAVSAADGKKEQERRGTGRPGGDGEVVD